MSRVLFSLLIVGALIVGVIWAADYDRGFFLLNKEYEQKVLLRFGGVVGDAITEPGFRWKIPLLLVVLFLVQMIHRGSSSP